MNVKNVRHCISHQSHKWFSLSLFSRRSSLILQMSKIFTLLNEIWWVFMVRRDLLRALPDILKDRAFGNSGEWLQTINYFCKILHLRYLTGVWIRPHSGCIVLFPPPQIVLLTLSTNPCFLRIEIRFGNRGK